MARLPTSGQFVLTNLVANRILVPYLRTRAGRRLGRRLAVVEYVGHRSGKPHRLVTQYDADGQTVRIHVGLAESKSWWRNFRAPRPLRLRLAGEDHDAVAHVEVHGHDVTVVALLDTEPARATHQN